MIETLASIQAIGYARATNATFGHLALKRNKTYDGWILFALTAWGDTTMIDFEFEGLDASPWFNDDILDHLTNYTSNLKSKPFGVFVWRGNYIKHKNGNCMFKGNFEEINCLTTNKQS